MSARSIAALATGLSLVAGVLVLGEHRAVSPGSLSAAHARWEGNCRACHAPLRGVESGCQHCHGALPAANVHTRLALACGSCHNEHAGRDARSEGDAGRGCTACHAHPSIGAVEQHRRSQIERPSEALPHLLVFSHRQHFRKIEQRIGDGSLSGDARDCQRCHGITRGIEGSGDRGIEGSGDQGIERSRREEHALLWSGCAACHESWKEIGLPNVAPAAAAVRFSEFIDAARLPRLRFNHSPGHLSTPCVDCHSGIPEAGPLRSAEGTADDSLAAAKRTKSCFGCHAHEPDASGSGKVVACSGCHDFHGSGAHADFPQPPGHEPVASSAVLGRVAGLTVTPWLLVFVACGFAVSVRIARRLPGSVADTAQADPDVAPQRVSEVPQLTPSYESSVPGLYIVGELAGVPLINRSIKSGFDAVDAIASRLQGRADASDVIDVLIAGAGPAGLGAATQAKSRGLSHVLCEKTTAAATIKNYPRAKIVQSAPIEIPAYGTFFQKDDESKEGLMRRWEDIIARTGLVVREHEEIIDVRREADGVLVSTVYDGRQLRSRAVVLAIGVRGSPRRLGVPGETAARVGYVLSDPEQYRERELLVVGGGNAACEAALALAAPALLNQVTLAHRGPVLRGVTAQNSQAVDAAAREDQLSVIPESQVKEIRARSVLLETAKGQVEIPNDFVIVLIGADLPTKFLHQIGVRLVRKGG